MEIKSRSKSLGPGPNVGALSALHRDVGYQPSVSLDEGLAKTVAWFRNYHKI